LAPSHAGKETTRFTAAEND